MPARSRHDACDEEHACTGVDSPVEVLARQRGQFARELGVHDDQASRLLEGFGFSFSGRPQDPAGGISAFDPGLNLSIGRDRKFARLPVFDDRRVHRPVTGHHPSCERHANPRRNPDPQPAFRDLGQTAVIEITVSRRPRLAIPRQADPNRNANASAAVLTAPET